MIGLRYAAFASSLLSIRTLCRFEHCVDKDEGDLRCREVDRGLISHRSDLAGAFRPILWCRKLRLEGNANRDDYRDES